jgi:hypothetical protein
MGPIEQYRVFRLDDGVPTYVGMFKGMNPKDAVKDGVYADESGGDRTYEVHVARNASIFTTRARDERFIDSIKQLNTQQFLAPVAPDTN